MLADAGVLAVHHKDPAGELPGCHAGALIGARQLGGQHHGDHRLPGLHSLGKGLLELSGGNLTGGGQVLPLNEFFIELPVVQVNAVLKLLRSEGDSHGEDGNLLPVGWNKVGGGIGNDPYFHGRAHPRTTRRSSVLTAVPTEAATDLTVPSTGA